MPIERREKQTGSDGALHGAPKVRPNDAARPVVSWQAMAPNAMAVFAATRFDGIDKPLDNAVTGQGEPEGIAYRRCALDMGGRNG